MSAGDESSQVLKIGFVVELSEEVLLYSGNMIIAPSASVWVLKSFRADLAALPALKCSAKYFLNRVLQFFISILKLLVKNSNEVKIKNDFKGSYKQNRI